MSRPRAGSSRHVARHEAAHALVAVRLGLVVISTDTRVRRVPGTNLESAGCTELGDGPREWLANRTDPTARERLAACAIEAAAGCAADVRRGLSLGHISHKGDIRYMVEMALALGIAQSKADPAVEPWAAEQVRIADAVLASVDDGAAWDRVAVALERKRILTGTEVCGLVFGSTPADAPPTYTAVSARQLVA